MGLRNLKIWAVYLLGAFAVITLAQDVYYYSQGFELSILSLVIGVVGLALA